MQKPAMRQVVAPSRRAAIGHIAAAAIRRGDGRAGIETEDDRRVFHLGADTIHAGPGGTNLRGGTGIFDPIATVRGTGLLHRTIAHRAVGRAKLRDTEARGGRAVFADKTRLTREAGAVRQASPRFVQARAFTAPGLAKLIADVRAGGRFQLGLNDLRLAIGLAVTVACERGRATPVQAFLPCHTGLATDATHMVFKIAIGRLVFFLLAATGVVHALATSPAGLLAKPARHNRHRLRSGLGKRRWPSKTGRLHNRGCSHKLPHPSDRRPAFARAWPDRPPRSRNLTKAPSRRSRILIRHPIRFVSCACHYLTANGGPKKRSHKPVRSGFGRFGPSSALGRLERHPVFLRRPSAESGAKSQRNPRSAFMKPFLV